MTTPSPTPDEYTLLCERCGYIIEGLPTDLPCPECSRPIALSLPERRTGTPWQQRRTARTLVHTWWRTLRHPLLTFDTLRLDEIRGFGMVVHTLFVCSVVCCLVASILEIPTIDQPQLLFFPIVVYAVFAFILGAALFFVIDLSGHALRILWRCGERQITPDTGWHIIGVASVGWVLTYAIWLAGWSATEIWRIIDPPLSDYELRQRVGYELFNILLPSLLGGFAAGFTVFLAYALLGFHRLRYANLARPETTSAPSTHAARD
jgi:hypothetical protein